jgi:hypothetical protein
MWERTKESSKWRPSGSKESGDWKVVDRDWLEWEPRGSDSDVKEEEGVWGGWREEDGESEKSEMESESQASGGEITDTSLSGRDGSSGLYDFGRLEEYLLESFDQVFQK